MMKDNNKVEIPMSVVFDHFPEIKKLADSFARNFQGMGIIDFLFNPEVSTAYVSSFGTLMEWATFRQTVLFVDEEKINKEIEALKQVRDQTIEENAEFKKNKKLRADLAKNKDYIKHTNKLIEFWETQLVLHNKRMEAHISIPDDSEHHQQGHS